MLDPACLPEPIWVVAPHPDDEALGCGGLLAALSDLGREVHALLVTDGGASHPHSVQYPRSVLAAQRLSEWRSGLLELGVSSERTVALGFPDGELTACDPAQVGSAVALAWAASPPATLLLPWRRDPHPDHRACWAAIEPLLQGVLCVLEYTVWLPERAEPSDWPRPDEGLTELLFPLFASQRHHKAAAIAAHASQLGLIRDDPTGFVLAPGMVQRAVSGPERFFRPNPTQR